MRILVYTDVHWSQYSSIVRKMGNKYSKRLENLIDSVNWVENLALEQSCDMIINLGDFFDKPELNAQELTALNDVKWADMEHYFLVGNHEMGINDLSYSSAHLLKMLPNKTTIIDKPCVICRDSINMVMIPYILEDARKPLYDYYKNKCDMDNYTIVFSHNDVAGIQMGAFVSKSGFNIDDIGNYCDLFMNGHIHNYGGIGVNGMNIGNLTGQNFSEDATKYKHGASIIDTELGTVSFIVNPYALNFYKLDLTSGNKYDILSNVSPNAVMSIKVKANDVDRIKEFIKNNSNIIESRLVIDYDNQTTTTGIEELHVDDHIEQFKKYIIDQLGATDVVISELGELV